MTFKDINLDGFDGREESLAKVKRYIHPITRIMFYRTNNFIHSRRVLWHLERAIPDIQKTFSDFDVEFARTLALVHDDVEILVGDVQLYDKEHMTNEELARLEERELEATYKLAERYPKSANGYDYLNLLLTAKGKDRLESRLVSFFDKFDAGGEAWHEVSAGNVMFLRPAGGIPNEGNYVRRLNEFPSKYPNLVPFFERFPTYLPESFDFSLWAERGDLHTEKSLEIDSGYPPYEMWKRTIMGKEGIKLLITQKEYAS